MVYFLLWDGIGICTKVTTWYWRDVLQLWCAVWIAIIMKLVHLLPTNFDGVLKNKRVAILVLIVISTFLMCSRSCTHYVICWQEPRQWCFLTEAKQGHIGLTVLRFCLLLDVCGGCVHLAGRPGLATAESFPVTKWWKPQFTLSRPSVAQCQSQRRPPSRS